MSNPRFFNSSKGNPLFLVVRGFSRSLMTAAGEIGELKAALATNKVVARFLLSPEPRGWTAKLV
jgi:hypothetical protein